MPRNKRKHPHSRYERIMLACIDSLPFKFHSPGQPNLPKEYKRLDTPVREHATDKRYREGRVMHDPDSFYQPGERGYIKARHPKIVPGHEKSYAVSPGKRSMN